jgi:type IV pilus assembly protein PilY1
MLYIGANDGMLHGFHANTGVEQFAFVPNGVYSKLSDLTSAAYVHKYFVDGKVHASDAYIGSSWKTILLGSLGAGGRGIYALDVTSPSSMSASNVLWELQGNSDTASPLRHLGYVLGEPTIVRTQSSGNYKWVAIFGNGYNSYEEKAVLFIVDLNNISNILTLDTKTGSSSQPNGMAAPLVIDKVGNRLADMVYAGDLHGNLWKIDMGNSNPSQWKFALGTSSTPKPLFTACVGGACSTFSNRQPITTKPAAIKHQEGGLTVLFGTGKYFSSTDHTVTSTPQLQAFYGIHDPGGNSTQQVTLSDLYQQTVIGEYEAGDAALNNTNVTDDLRITSKGNQQTIIDNYDGWYLNLIGPGATSGKGERVVSNPLGRFGRAVFVTYTPDEDPCSGGGQSWLMELDGTTGNRLDSQPFDITSDGNINDLDKILVTIGSEVGIEISSGKRFDEKIATPGVVEAPDGGDEIKILSGSSGNLHLTTEEGRGATMGRQSWRQLR